MVQMTFDEVLQAAKALPRPEQTRLIRQLQIETDQSITAQEYVMAELAQRRASGGSTAGESLRGKFAREGEPFDADEVDAYLHSLNSEWEEDLDDIC